MITGIAVAGFGAGALITFTLGARNAMPRPLAPHDWLGVPRRAISRLNSPIDITLLRRFAQKSELAAGDTIYEYMRLVGEDLLEFLRVAREKIEYVARHVERQRRRTLGEVVRPVHGDAVVGAGLVAREGRKLPDRVGALRGSVCGLYANQSGETFH